MKPQTFESYLEQVAPSEVHTNNSPEGFERWVENLDVAEVMAFAEDYGVEIYKQAYIKGGSDTLNEVNSLASNPN
jgi:hypothetical protein